MPPEAQDVINGGMLAIITGITGLITTLGALWKGHRDSEQANKLAEQRAEIEREKADSEMRQASFQSSLDMIKVLQNQVESLTRENAALRERVDSLQAYVMKLISDANKNRAIMEKYESSEARD